MSLFPRRRLAPPSTVARSYRRGIIRSPAMYVYRSNRTEELLGVLAELVSRPLSDPLTRECIVVQGRGMERWLAMELSRKLGIWANPDFPFPRHFIERAFTSVLGGQPQSFPGPEQLTWSIARLLDELQDDPRMEPICHYLEADPGPRRRLDLARRIAWVFDRYALYRQRRVRDWEQGGGEDWQALLWHRLTARLGSWHLGARAERFLAALASSTGPLVGLPERVSLFGLSALPPLYVEVLSALAERFELHLFILSPSREYFGEIRSAREIGRQLDLFGDPSTQAEDLHLESGHPLLASLGKLGRDFQQTLEGVDGYQEPDHDLYQDPGTGNLLHTLQSDILHLRHRRSAEPDCAPLPIAPDDRSIQLHSCYGPLRELEVLHDQIAGLLQDDPSLVPRDVLVMTPDIGAYAPFVEAVFGGTADPKIAYRVADRGFAVGHPVIEAFQALLALLGSRLGAGEVLDFIAREPVRGRCGLDIEQLEALRHRFSRAGARWGSDAEHRQALDQPAEDVNTWRFAIDRLLLGFAMAGEGRQMFAGVMPFDDIEGSDGEPLGRLSEWLEHLLRLHQEARAPRTPRQWRDLLVGALERLIVLDDSAAAEHQLLRETLGEVAATAEKAGFSDPIELVAWAEALTPLLDQRAPASGFLEGGVTFCELVPMRTLPFRVVCLVGMNDGAYPRIERRPGFDLLVTEPRSGDRSRRDEDRYLFLEAVLSARDRLVITYTGRSPRDGGEQPPSVLVGELLDSLNESFRVAGQEPQEVGDAVVLHRRLIVEHPLQAFDPRYFVARTSGVVEDLWSFRTAAAAGARALGQSPPGRLQFLDQALDVAEEKVTSLDLADLVRFFRRPWRDFLRQRLGLYLGAPEDLPPDREPLDLVGLDGWRVGQRVLGWRLAGMEMADAYELVRAAGELPPGMSGKVLFERLDLEVERLAEAAEPWHRGSRHDTTPFEGELLGANQRYVLAGRFDDLWPTGLVEVRYGKAHSAAQLGLWIRHLALNWALGEHHSVLVGRDKSQGVETVCFAPPNDPGGLLLQLLELYSLGQRWPLVLFPEASAAYVAKLDSPSGHPADEAQRAAALRSAGGKLRGRYRSSSELDEPEIRRLFGGVDPITDHYPVVLDEDSWAELQQASFTSVAETVFGPLLRYREEPS